MDRPAVKYSELQRKFDDADDNFMCRVYDKRQPLFVTPYNGTTIGAFKCDIRNTHMQLQPAHTLTKRAMAIHMNERDIVFLAIRHSF